MNRPTIPLTGRMLTGLFALFILSAFVAPMLLRLPVAEATMAELGWQPVMRS